jgi:hypothetical protein
MTSRLIALSIAALCLVGCGKKSESVTPATPVQSGGTPAQGNLPAPGTAPTQGGAPAPTNPDLADLDRAVRSWILANKRWPTNFAEFAATTDVQIPTPPAGKKYSLDSRMHVILVNN